MSKKNFKTVPQPKPVAQSDLESFVQGGHGKDDKSANTEKQKTVKAEPTRRLTVDMPKSLHLRFKSLCARHELKMNDEVRQMIEARCLELEG